MLVMKMTTMFYSRHLKNITYKYYEFLESFKQIYKYDYEINVGNKIYINISFNHIDKNKEETFDVNFRNAFDLVIGNRLNNVYTIYSDQGISSRYTINYTM